MAEPNLGWIITRNLPSGKYVGCYLFANFNQFNSQKNHFSYILVKFWEQFCYLTQFSIVSQISRNFPLNNNVLVKSLEGNFVISHMKDRIAFRISRN